MLFPTNDASDGATSPGMAPEPFARLLGHLLAYKGWLAAAAVLGLLLTGLALCFVTPRYEAQAVVIVDSRRNKLADAEGALSSIVVDQYQSALKSELELLRSPDLARHVITSLGLLDTSEYAEARTHTPMAARFAALREDVVQGVGTALAAIGLAAPDTPGMPAAVLPAAVLADGPDATMENAVRIFSKAFWVDNEPKSLTIRMGYRSAQPRLAAAVTNAALRRYLAADEEVKAAAVERSQAWLQGRIVALRANLDMAEHAVEDFRATHNLATSRDRSPLQLLLLQLQGREVDARAEVAAAQAKVTLGGKGSSADVLSSRLVQSLRQQEAGLLAEQARLSATLRPSHPSMVRIDSELARLGGALRDEVDRIGQSKGSDLRQAQARLADVTAQIQAVQERINAANGDDIRLRSLEQDAAAKRAVLTTFTQRYDQDAGTPLTLPDSRVVSWASVPVDPGSPRYGLVLVGGTLGFVGLAFLLSLGFERLRPGFGSLDELTEELGLVTAGLTPALRQRTMRRSRSVAALDPPPMRALALTVRALAHTPAAGTPTRVVLVTSAIAGEGKSTVALSLARSTANGGQRCLLIDADIRKPTLHASLRVPATPGLVELTLDRAPLADVTRAVAGERFDFVAAGRPTQDALSPFTIKAFGGVLAELKRHYDVIVIDSPPVLLAFEGLVLSGCADMTLFVVKWRSTPREIARKAARLLARCSAGPCLAVLSQVNLRHLRRDDRQMEQHYRGAYQYP